MQRGSEHGPRDALIVGSGRLAALLAVQLRRERCAVGLVDADRGALEVLAESLGVAAFVGDPLDPEVLRRAGVERADLVIAASPSDDRNAGVALVVRRVFGARRVLVRCDDVGRAAAYGRLGIETLCLPEAVAAAVLGWVAGAARPTESGGASAAHDHPTEPRHVRRGESKP